MSALTPGPVQSANVVLDTTDAFNTIMAGVAGKVFRVLSLQPISLVADAQAITVVEETAGTLFLSLPPSLPVGVYPKVEFGSEGKLTTTVGKGLLIAPTAAGPKVHIFCEYQLVDKLV